MTDLEQFMNDMSFQIKLVRQASVEYRNIINGELIAESVGYKHMVNLFREFQVNLITSGKIKEVDGRFIENL